MRLSIIHKLAFGVFAMRPEAAEAYYPLVTDVLVGNRQTMDDDGGSRRRSPAQVMDDFGIKLVTRDGDMLGMEQAARELDPNTKDLVAVIPIKGAIMKDDWCGDPGMETVAGWVRMFEADSAISGFAYDVDSPGGDGYGMLTMTTALAKASKPRVGIVRHGMACSAAYGILSGMDLAFTAHDVDEIGSIGTYVTLRDVDKYWESKGLSIHKIYATKSTRKNKDFTEALKGPEHYASLQKNYIDPFNDAFIQTVQKNRPGVKDEHGVLNGEVFMARDAVNHGLIDSVGHDLDSAVSAVRDLVKQRNTRN